MNKISEKAQELKVKAKKTLRVVAVVIVAILVFVMLFLYYGTYSTGVRAGVVLKVSKKGTIIKTNEGQLDLLSFGAVKSDNQLSQTFEFSVQRGNEEVYQALEDVALSGERVRLRYEEKYVTLPWRGDTKYFVVGVERIENPDKPDLEKNSKFPN